MGFPPRDWGVSAEEEGAWVGGERRGQLPRRHSRAPPPMAPRRRGLRGTFPWEETAKGQTQLYKTIRIQRLYRYSIDP
ncbi:hypothetical protein E2C01_093829 [Portunus trituberculatus]|uniref:Uncharacterized protein n=1 Tax=Portunus trituberculatus TaxID=210409 RepID=A0A5B7JUJ0_PORTR|nr:hypothetical protein [Portunus trituberculatus]